ARSLHGALPILRCRSGRPYVPGPGPAVDPPDLHLPRLFLSRAVRRRPSAADRRCRPGLRAGPRARRPPRVAPPGEDAAPAGPAARPCSLLLPLEVGHQPLIGTGHHLHELPAVLTPLVEDLLGGVDDQRNRRVFPACHGTILRTFGYCGAPSRPWCRPSLADHCSELVGVYLCEGAALRLHRRHAAQQCPSLPLGHSAPDPVLDPVVQRIHQALQPDRTVETDLPRLPLRGPPYEQLVRRTLGAQRPKSPFFVELGVHSPPLFIERPQSPRPLLGDVLTDSKGAHGIVRKFLQSLLGLYTRNRPLARPGPGTFSFGPYPRGHAFLVTTR